MAISTPTSSPALPDVERRAVMPRGFRAGGSTAGIKASGRPDLGLVFSPDGASAAAVFTPNAFAAAPVKLSRANLDLARVTAERWRRLQEQGVLSRQDADTKAADLAVKEATTQKAEATLATAQDTIRASQANLRRLEEIYAQHTGKGIEDVSRDMERDFFMSPEEAKEYGIIDTVITHREVARQEVAA